MFLEGSKILLLGPTDELSQDFKTLTRDELNSLEFARWLDGPSTMLIHVACIFDVPSKVVTKFDMVLALPDKQRSHRMKLHELFFATSYKTFKEFNMEFERTTSDFGVLIKSKL